MRDGLGTDLQALELLSAGAERRGLKRC